MPEYSQMFQITGVPTVNAGIGGVLLKPWDQRVRSAHEIQQDLQARWNKIAGARVAAFSVSTAAGRIGIAGPVRDHHDRAVREPQYGAQQVMEKARASGKFYFIDADLKIDKPQATVIVDRDKIAALGLTSKTSENGLSAALGGGYVNYFSIAGRSYKVIPQVLQVDRLNPSEVLNYYIKTPTPVSSRPAPWRASSTTWCPNRSIDSSSSTR